ncbi:MAG: restriction endonuclease subunit S [Methylomicrobium sp.]
MSVLPNGWAETSIFTISRPKQWKTISTKDLTFKGFPIYGANGIIGCYTSFTHENPTLMITCRGASCGNIHKSLPKSYINGNAMALDNLSPQVNIDYLYYFLKSADFKNVISGSAQPQITQEGLQNLNVRIAPLNEQIRIADKLDKVLAKVDAAQARLEKIPTLLKRFRQAALAAATSGELTREWRVNNAEESSWSVLPLGNIAEIFTGVTPLKKETSYYEGGTIPWLTSSVTGKSLVTEAENFVTEKAVKECRLKLFSPGTLLVAMYGEGKTRGQVTEIAIGATINQACAAVVVNQEIVERKYIKISIENNYEKTRMMAEGGNQPNLNLAKVRSIPINLPSKLEQAEIVRRVESLFALADTVEKQYLAAKKRIDRLTQSLLAKAFRGELVPQDPNDEPAIELLARIKASKATEAPKQTRKPATRKAIRAFTEDTV